MTTATTGTGVPAFLSWARRWRWTILGGFAVVLIAVDLLTMLIPETYHSEVSFLVEPRNPQTLSPAFSVLEKLGGVKSTETEIELLRSRSVVEPVVEELALHLEARVGGERVPLSRLFSAVSAGSEAEPGEYRMRPSGKGVEVVDATGRVLARGEAGTDVSFAGVSLRLGKASPEEVELRVERFGKVVKEVRDRIDAVTVNPDADVINLACAARTAEAAKALCAGISESYLLMRSTLRRAEATATAEFLQGQVGQVGAQLAAAEDEMRAYEKANRVVALEERATEGVRQFAQLKAQRDQLAAEREALGSWIGTIDEGSVDSGRFRELASFPTLFRSQSQSITQLLASLVELENRRSELRVIRAVASPEVAAIDERIGEVEGQLHQLAIGYERALTAQVRSLDDLLEQSGQELSAIPSQQIASARLERQVSLLEDLYRFLQTRLQEAEVAQAVNLPSVRVVDPASLPYRPSWPSRPLNLAIGAILGLGVGVLAGLFREHSDRRIRARDDLERVTGISVLGLVPHLPTPGPVVPLRLPGGAPAKSGALVRYSPETELALEAFRSIWTDVGFLTARGEQGPIRTVAVTSTTRAEGKTFIVCNLAATRAERGVRTLLLDADIRGNGIARFFRFPERQPGCSDVLAGRVELSDAVRELTVGEGHPLHLLPAGSPTTRSAELIESRRFDVLLDQLSGDHELVIIDTPPLNVLTDAASIAARVDAVIVVVRGESTEREALRYTLERLRRANGHVIGLVLNDTRLPHHYQSYSHAEPATPV